MGNCTDVVFSFQVYIGSRGVVNLTGALPGMGLEGTGVTCDCDYMWTGPTCSHPCPYPYDEVHGICFVAIPKKECCPTFTDHWKLMGCDKVFENRIL